ncbi:peroxiredoxin [bacterium]|nr:peroxiredoxin [bacterium]
MGFILSAFGIIERSLLASTRRSLLAISGCGVATVAGVGFAPGAFDGSRAFAANIAVEQTAPDFTLVNQDGKSFKLSDRKGSWTVVYFYPKADSPGCTEQACAFRDAIKKIESRNAKLVGISTDTQASQKAFHEKHHLTFDLLADSDAKVTSEYGLKVPVLGVARRTTFIVDPQLKVRSIARDVDPAFDAEWSAETLDELQSSESPAPKAKGQKS